MMPRCAEYGLAASNRSAEHGFMPTTRSAEHGFTLIEVMVALLIFGLIATAGVALLSFSVRAQAAGGAKLDSIAAVERTTSLLAADLAQAVDRRARDERGTRLPAFAGDAAGLTLVRGGWTNVDAAPRASLQKVQYRLAGDAIERIAWPAVDGAAPQPPVAILSGIRGVSIRYRLAGAWSDHWDGTQGAPLPQALELTVDRAQGGPLRAMFLVGSGAPPKPPEVRDAQ